MNDGNALPLETRSVEQVIDGVRARARLGAGDPLGEALLHIFGRYFEIVAERLNLAPEKHRLVFLDLLGTKPAPPAAARVPLTFYPVQQLTQGDPNGGLTTAPASAKTIPARTQVAAVTQGPGDPPVFETERPLELTGALLTQVLAHDPADDRVADYSLLASETVPGVRPFVDQVRPARHEFCIAWPVVLDEAVSSIGVHFEFEPGAPVSARQLIEWSVAAPVPVKLRPLSDTTEGLTRSGEVVFGNFGVWPSFSLRGTEARWLCCKLISPLPRAGVKDREDGQGPVIRRVGMSARIEARAVPAQSAFFNTQPLDLSAGCYPLGLSPRFGDVFYLGSPLLAHPSASVTLHVELADAASTIRDAADLSLRPLDTPPLVWEGVSDGLWVPLDVDDGTQGLTESGRVRLRLPQRTGPIAVNGLESGWIRVRVAARTARERDRIRAPVIEPAGERPAPLTPVLPFLPAIERLRIDVSKAFASIPVESMLRVDDVSSVLVPVNSFAPAAPFERIPSDDPTLYLRFDGATRDLAAGTGVFFFVRESPEGRVTDDTDRNLVSMRAEYWDGCDWRSADLADETRGLTRTGLVTLRCDLPWRAGPFAGTAAYWARLVWRDERQPRLGLLARAALNTVMAINALSVQNELLGSSDHAPNQIYMCARRPIVDELQLEVLEPQGAPAVELASGRVADRRTLMQSDALPAVAAMRWVRWQAVESFAGTGPDDRHFVLDPWTGRVQFGDGRTGRIPPAGANNIRIRRYRVGGGRAGNVAAQAVTELRSTASYVSSVMNLVPASGGSDLETVQRVGERGSAWLRHRDRAVTREDYEDLAMAVPGIARARCLPLRDLDADPEGKQTYAGRVSVIVVPDDLSVAPRPGNALLRRVHQHLALRKPPEVQLTVLGPSYVMLEVSADIVCYEDEDTDGLAAECRVRLDAYLHPLTGGPERDGWRFGQRAVQARLRAVLQGVEGVRQVRSLDILLREERPGLLRTRSYLICAGRHQIRCIGAARFAMGASP